MIYLDVPFREKDQAKQLGARWDAVSKRWYIPDELSDDTTIFSKWLPQQIDLVAAEPADNLSPNLSSNKAAYLAVNQIPGIVNESLAIDTLAFSNEKQPSGVEGISLSRMLSKVQNAIRLHVPGAVWVVAEIANLNTRRGHVYLELTETSENGKTLASCRSMIWQSQAKVLLATFETQTGSPLEAGQQVLLLVEPTFHHQFGFSLVIQDIDPSYTLGEQERKLNELRKNLVKKGIYLQNKEHILPKDFFRIAVIAPVQAAGLGDFRADADVLQKNSLCEFKYFYSSFQGNLVENELVEAFQAVESLHKSNPYDAVVIIRGGGAKLDLNQLNVEAVAAKVCQLSIPVLSGIGHERDNTIIDEVANKRFDTPSKVIGFISQQIFEQAQLAKSNWQSIEKSSAIRVHYLHNKINQLFALVQQNSQSTVYGWQNKIEPINNNIRHLSQQTIHRMSQNIESQHQFIENQVLNTLQRKNLQAEQLKERVFKDAQRAVESQKKQIIQSISFILSSGPKVQLNRGFSIVKDMQGAPVTKAKDALKTKELQIEFADGSVLASVK